MRRPDIKCKYCNKSMLCPKCQGTGRSHKYTAIHCGSVNRGRYCLTCGADLAIENALSCETCKGIGYVAHKDCGS
ncbi:hypothetical protein GF312_00405 [Candidatus Poribacteria bacterium]|nr:hypothetical protein [Candidatus Poribacteria bacterium]